MLAFQAGKVVHGTCILDVLGQDCQRISLAVALQRRGFNVVVAQHGKENIRLAKEHDTNIATVKRKRAQGLNKQGTPLKSFKNAS